MSVQQQLLSLLEDLQRKYGIAYIFISHDLAVIRAMAHSVLVMKDGRVLESGTVASVLTRPSQPYTQRLLAASERSEEHTSALQSLMRISYAVFCLKKNNTHAKL